MNERLENPAIIALSSSSMAVAEEVRSAAGGEIHALKERVEQADVLFDNVANHLGTLFSEGRAIIGVMAAGALFRLLAPHVGDKYQDPPVLAIADDGSSIVPLLGGHHGANQLAHVLAGHLGGHAAITTAGDVRFGVALDDPPPGWRLCNPGNSKTVMAALLAGSGVRMRGERAEQAQWLLQSQLPFDPAGDVILTATDSPKTAGPAELVYCPQNLVLGVGCERGVGLDELRELMSQTSVNSLSISCVASIDLKADETAIHQLASDLGVPARFFSAEELEREATRLENPSEVVFAEVGCHGVAEGAVLAAAGPTGELLVPKLKSKRATMAVGRCGNDFEPLAVGRVRGHLSVVGIGPGNSSWRSPEVTQLISAASDLVGYSLYLDLLGDLTAGKTRHDFDLGKEEERVRHAMELAGQGRNVALVCSGDAGIYAMATLVFELIDCGELSNPAQRIGIEISPGISALQAAAARTGAPLGHDFCTISLSDLLTPWETIQLRIKAAAEADFVIAFYNPVSRRRRTQLAYARDVLKHHRGEHTPVVLASNLGRVGEKVCVIPLGQLEVDDVDMLTIVIVGSSDTRLVETGDGKSWVYTPRGYSAKSGTRLGTVA